jgi:glycerol-3-phosphate acyltransferase PlsX
MGLNGIAVKSHGGTDALGFSNAIGVAADMIMHRALARITEDFGNTNTAAVSRPQAAEL